MSEITKEAILSCPSLPSLPTVAMDVLELTRDSEVKLSEIARVIQNDQALCTKILKTVNSSYYGLTKPCPTISRALAYLGLSTVKSLVLGFSLVDIAGMKKGKFDYVSYWRHNLFSAAAARRIAGVHQLCDAEEAFVAALMQDVGMIALNAALPEEYPELVEQTEGDHRKLPHLEFERWQFDHADLGSMVGTICWRLPESLVEAIRLHHDGAQAVNHKELVQSVAMASQAAIVLTIADPAGAIRHFERQAGEWFGFRGADIQELLESINEDAKELSSLFKVKTGAQPDVATIMQQAEEASIEHQLTMQREADQLRAANQQLAEKAHTDALTGIGNRQRFEQELEHRYDQAKSFKGCLGIVLGDVDRFKAVNDDHGHQVGDAVLAEVGRRLASVLRGSDMVCRYGGEEFVAVLPGATLRDAAAVAERLRVAVESEPFEVGLPEAPPALDVTSSFGVAVFDPESASLLNTSELLVQAADRALYAAKEAGRNCVRVFRPAPKKHAA